MTPASFFTMPTPMMQPMDASSARQPPVDDLR
jgi:hypothetical protein